MGKDIIIQDDYYKENHISGVTKFRTKLESGGYCYWVPEDEASGSSSAFHSAITITTNGVYKASEYPTSDGQPLDGFSEVTVNVPKEIYIEGNHISEALTNVYFASNGFYFPENYGGPNTIGFYGVEVDVPVSFPLTDITISNNGIYRISEWTEYLGSYYAGFDTVLVDVPQNVSLQTATFYENGEYYASDYECDGFEAVTVDVRVEPNVRGIDISENGNYTASDYECDGFSEVTVEVEPQLYSGYFSQNGLYQFPEGINSPETAKAHDGYDQVMVDVLYSPDIVDRTVQYINDDITEIIGAYAFAGCSRLRVANFPNCTYIGRSAFYECTMLSALYIYNNYVYIEDAIFSPSAIPSIYVADHMVSEFKENNFSIYSDHIFPYNG